MDQVTLPDVLSYLGEFALDPLAYVHACWPWGTGELANFPGPRGWQADVLSLIASHVGGPSPHTPLRIAIASGHGIGKSALTAFVTKWALGTCPDAKCVITANTANQLLSKTSPELSKWFRMAIDAEAWDAKTLSITSRDPASAKTWRCDLIPWNETNSEAFSGLHNVGRIILCVFDEASSIPRSIWDAASGFETDENTIIIKLAFGNPTIPTGPFRECFSSSQWHHFQIDSRQVEGTNKELFAKWAEERGEDSDFFRVRVRGEFPIQGNAQFISSDVVHAARHGRYDVPGRLPRVIAVDVARFGEDASVIGMRQGRRFTILETIHGKPTDFVGERVIHWIKCHSPAATVVDETGVGAGVIDYVRARGFNQDSGYPVWGFNGGAASNQQEYYNRRVEVWALMKDWLAAGASIPDDAELGDDLTSMTFDYARGKIKHGSIMLESKDDLKRRGLRSPDKGDTLAMTFHVTLPEVQPDLEYQDPEEEKYRSMRGRMGEDAWMA